MTRFRGSDEALEREVALLQGLVQLRLRRATADLRELEEALRELKAELRRRRAQLAAQPDESAPSTVPV